MTTDVKKSKKSDKKKAKRAARDLAKKFKGWTRVTCRAICGCCESVLYYKTRKRAEAACREATNKHAVMVDDQISPSKESIDGFYGFDIEDI